MIALGGGRAAAALREARRRCRPGALLPACVACFCADKHTRTQRLLPAPGRSAAPAGLLHLPPFPQVFPQTGQDTASLTPSHGPDQTSPLPSPPTTRQADIWSFGILVWEIVTGEDLTQFQPLAISRQLPTQVGPSAAVLASGSASWLHRGRAGQCIQASCLAGWMGHRHAVLPVCLPASACRDRSLAARLPAYPQGWLPCVHAASHPIASTSHSHMLCHLAPPVQAVPSASTAPAPAVSGREPGLLLRQPSAHLLMPAGAPPVARFVFEACTQLDADQRPAAAQLVEWLRGGAPF